MIKGLFKNVVSIAVTTTLVVTTMAGCNVKTSTNNNITTVRVWTNDGGTKEFFTNQCNEFNNTIGKEKGIKIEYTVYGSDFKQVYELAFENDQAPELVAAHGKRLGYVKNGDIIPISDLPGGQEFLDEYGATYVNDVDVFDGKVYSVPAKYTLMGLIYNKDLFKAAGIVDSNGNALPPKTWEEVRECAKRITDAKKMVYGISLPLKWSGFYKYMLQRPFEVSYQDVGKIDWNNLTYDYSNLKYPLQWLLNIKNDNSFFPGAESLDNDASRAQFAEGRVGMFFGASWDVGVFKNQFTTTCDWGVAPFPVVNEENRYYQKGEVGSMLCVSKSALKTDMAKVMEVYKWFYSIDIWSKLYNNELEIPYNKKATQNAIKQKVQNTSLHEVSPQWAQFGNLLDITLEAPIAPALTLEGDDTMAMTLKVWAGTISIDECINELNKRYTNALKKGVADGSIKVENYNKEYDFRYKNK